MIVFNLIWSFIGHRMAVNQTYYDTSPTSLVTLTATPIATLSNRVVFGVRLTTVLKCHPAKSIEDHLSNIRESFEWKQYETMSEMVFGLQWQGAYDEKNVSAFRISSRPACISSRQVFPFYFIVR